MTKDKTSAVVSVAALGLLAYEIYTLANRKPGDTISETAWRACKRPLVPFTLGMLLGHWVWQSQDVYEDYWKGQVE